MAKVELKNISKTYDGNIKVVENATITVEDKEFVVLVGPSGCGKSTTLRMIAGLEDITEGDLFIDGEKMNDVPSKDRNIAMVFQNYALYPHMSVYDNMAFGLKIKKVPKAEIDQRVHETANILDIEKFLDRKPRALSGGQRQRVAVGRAIVRNPKVFLFDEPLSNLDAKLRVQMRAELSDLHIRLNATMIYVTHDQVEAMTMADKIVVMNNGLIQQIGNPLHLYNKPSNKFVASFIGSPPMNFLTLKADSGILKGKGFTLKPAAAHTSILKDYSGRDIYFGIRPEDLSYTKKPASENNIPAKITMVEPLGADIHLLLYAEGNQPMVARTTPDNSFKVGDTVNFKVNMEKAHYFACETELSLAENLN